MQLQDLSNSEKTYHVPFDETVTVELRHITRNELREMNKKCTVKQL